MFSPTKTAYQLIAVVAVFIIQLVFTTAQATTEAPDDWLGEATATIKLQEQQLKAVSTGLTDADFLSEPLKTISHIKSQAQTCITDTESQLQKATLDLTILGEISRKENPEVAKKRKSLTKEQKELDTKLATCKLLLLQSQDLITSINDLQQNILAQQLSARTPNIIDVLDENIRQPAAGFQDTFNFLSLKYQSQPLSKQQLVLLTLLFIAGISLGIMFKRMLRQVVSASAHYEDSVAVLTLAVQSSISSALPVLLPVLFTAAFFSIALPLKPLPFITKASYAFAIYLGIALIIKIILNPKPPARSYFDFPKKYLIKINWHLQAFAIIGLIGYFFLTGEIKSSFTEAVYYLNRSIFSVALIINLILILWLLRHFPWAILSKKPRIFLILTLIATLIIELSGFRNLSTFILGGLLGTSIGLVITLIISHFLKDLCDGLDEGRLNWEIRFRKYLGLADDSLMPGLIWIRFILFTGLWGGFIIITMHIWHLNDPWLTTISGYITEGFEIGSLRVTPTLLASGLLALVVLLSLTRYAKNHILPHGLKHTRLDHGAKEAVTSLIGYAGVAIAILVALSITGVKMENVALIAGALSVGIGFGLQNIVNNFISGLILLFERPIRSGDWIVTGDTEGYVKSINIRSTQIQTFDKADVIVPNSELITAKVTNWMLRDNFGRVKIPIGVSYDSDVNKVHKILLNIANSHPMVIKKNAQLSPPKVLFINFGDSSLNFELRCFIYNVDQRLNVTSELNFSILKQFRVNNIEIPFPQRVITMNKPDTGDDEPTIQNL